MAPPMPYDFSGYLADQLQKSTGLAQGYTTQIDSFRDELDQVDTLAETGYAPVLGGSVLGALGAALAGGNIGQIAGSAYGAGTISYNNLEAMEKTKRENLQKEIALNEVLLKDELNFSQQLVGAQNTYNMNRDLSYMRGEMPGTSPYNIEQQDLYNRQMALVGERNLGRVRELDAPADQDNINLLASMGVALGEGASNRDVDLAFKMLGEKRRQAEQAGGRVEKLPTTALADISAASAAEPALQRNIEIINRFQSDPRLPKDPTSKLFVRDFLQLLPADQQTLFQNELGFIAANVAKGIYGSGTGLSDREGQIIQDFLSGREAIALNEIVPRLQRLQMSIRDNAANTLQTFGSQLQYQTNSQRAAQQWLSTLPPDARQKYEPLFAQAQAPAVGGPVNMGGTSPTGSNSDKIAALQQQIQQLMGMLQK